MQIKPRILIRGFLFGIYGKPVMWLVLMGYFCLRAGKALSSFFFGDGKKRSHEFTKIN